jgi:4-amino-4-deoxy-L-arabinose transferase-like glycosyltransferase
MAALVVRVAWAVAQPSDDAAIDRLPDQREYLSLGRNLLSGSLSFRDPRFDQVVYAYRTPGYPAFVAAFGASPLAVRIAQVVVDTSTVLAVYLIARQLSGGGALALIAAALTAFNPFLIYFSGLLLSETLFTATLAWAVWLLLRRRWLPGAIVMLLAVLVRPSAILLGPLLAMVAALANPPSDAAYRLLPTIRRAVAAGAVVAVVTIVGLLPWAWRNYRVLGSWVWTTTNSGVTLYDGFHDGATGASDQRFLAQMPQLRSMNEVERSAYLQHAARQWINDHRAELPQLTAAKIARTWSPVPLSAEFARRTYAIVSGLYAVPLYLLVVIGLFSRRLSGSAKLLLVTPAIYFTIVHALSVGSLRYRVPVEPELAIIAGAGAIALFVRDTANGEPRIEDRDARAVSG